jgi:hypothetical protein
MMDADDIELLTRSLEHATTTTTGDALDAALGELGWTDALAADPRAAISILFELQGRATATSSALGLVLTHGLDLDPDPAVGVVLPRIGEASTPAHVGSGIDGVASGGLRSTELALVVTAADAGPDVAVTVPTASLELEAIEGVDPDLGLLRVGGTVEDPTGVGIDPQRWDTAVAVARLAVAHELVGASRTMLAQAREHALERVQFGRPISQFQAIRHRLAETLVAIETADALLDAAWLDGTVGTAAMAKAMAGRSARTTARHCQQVLAGIGFTTEHDLHRSIRRTLVLDATLGSSTTITAAAGAELVATRQLLPLLPL